MKAQDEKCTKDTCDSANDHVLFRCFGGFQYATNCNMVLNVGEKSARCYPGLGVNGASICDLVSRHNSTNTSVSISKESGSSKSCRRGVKLNKD